MCALVTMTLTNDLDGNIFLSRSLIWNHAEQHTAAQAAFVEMNFRRKSGFQAS